MSFKVVGWVMEHSESTLAARLVLLAYAEVSHDDGNMAFLKVETVMRKARVKRSTAIGCLRRLEADGRLTATGVTKRGTTIYKVETFAFGPEPERTSERLEKARGPESGPVQNLDKGVQNLDVGVQNLDHGVTNHQEPPLTVIGGERAHARLPRVAGKEVELELWTVTCAALESFNAQAGKSLGPLTSAGAASEAAKRIYQRVRDWPDLSADQHADIIRRALASKWWGDGEPSIGVVYGPKVFEENMTRDPGKPKGNDARRARTQRRLARARGESE